MTNTEEKENQSKEQRQPEEWTEFAPTLKRQSDEPEEAPEIRTSLPLPARPIVKGGFALALSGSALVLVWIFFQLASGISWNKAKPTNEQENYPVAEKPSAEMTAEEKLQWCLATRECGNREDPPLKKLTRAAKADPKVASQKKKREELAARSPTRPTTSYTTAQDVGRPVRFSRYVPPPTPPEPPLSSPVRSAQPVRSDAVASTQVEQTPDPVALLAQASQLGIYTTGEGTSLSSPSAQRSRSTGLVAAQRLVEASGGGSAELSDRPEKNLQLEKVIPVTTRIKAIVATSISWVGSKAEQKFRISTTEDMKAEDGSIVTPKGTYLLAQVNQSNSSGYVEVQILSVRIDGQEKAIPPDVIIVQGTDGEPLQAKVKNKGRGLNNMVVAAGLAGISEAASSINSAEITFGDSKVSGGGSNIGAGMVEGVTGSLSQQISDRVSGASRNRTSDGPVLVLKEGTKLELFINQPLNL